ncbi:hypothetical protein Y032_0017g3327 [Ancylostoma ceylanicum]|uniref:Uncharacterized protein n=1 Tax=Ancylostoma ceylanicum TaxID=53326 RepID=A0A016V6P0_9BILA|nr:hypothetical protein Y032_0017g3327 [Ancylostoma ceylanicum]
MSLLQGYQKVSGFRLSVPYFRTILKGSCRRKPFMLDFKGSTRQSYCIGSNGQCNMYEVSHAILPPVSPLQKPDHICCSGESISAADASIPLSTV